MHDPNGQGLILAGDVGGTKTNLALFSPDPERPVPRMIETFRSSDATALEGLLDRFLDKHPADVASACFGVAGPVMGGTCATTNLPWIISGQTLQNRYGWRRVRLINDLVAMATAIPLLNPTETHQLNAGQTDPTGNAGLIAPGTGLGMALLVRCDGKLRPIPSEGGHADFAPRNTKEIDLLSRLLRSMDHVSLEDLVSGPGLLLIYRTLRDLSGTREPSWLSRRMSQSDPSAVVSNAALEEGEPVCLEALDMFVSILGGLAGNLALTGITTTGIWLGGGICPKILEKLENGIFMHAFVSKGTFKKILRDIPVNVILEEKTALLGAACCAQEAIRQSSGQRSIR